MSYLPKIACVFLLATASGVAAEKPQVIPPERLANYWLLASAGRANAEFPGRNLDAPIAAPRFPISSKKMASAPARAKLERLVPDGDLGKVFAVGVVAGMRFAAAKQNLGKDRVFTYVVIPFNLPDANSTDAAGPQQTRASAGGVPARQFQAGRQAGHQHRPLAASCECFESAGRGFARTVSQRIQRHAERWRDWRQRQRAAPSRRPGTAVGEAVAVQDGFARGSSGGMDYAISTKFSTSPAHFPRGFRAAVQMNESSGCGNQAAACRAVACVPPRFALIIRASQGGQGVANARSLESASGEYRTIGKHRPGDGRTG